MGMHLLSRAHSRVQSDVLTGGHNFEVFGPVVRFHMVEVVNNLVPSQGAAQVLLHNKTVLGDKTMTIGIGVIGHEDNHVPFGVGMAPALPSGRHGAALPPHVVLEGESGRKPLKQAAPCISSRGYMRQLAAATLTNTGTVFDIVRHLGSCAHACGRLVSRKVLRQIHLGRVAMPWLGWDNTAATTATSEFGKAASPSGVVCPSRNAHVVKADKAATGLDRFAASAFARPKFSIHLPNILSHCVSGSYPRGAT